MTFRGREGEVLNSVFFVALDLGKVRDPSAVAIVERVEMVGRWDGVAFAHRKEVELRLRYLERMELGLSYPEVIRRVKPMLESDELRGRCCLLVDSTGGGIPVVDFLREAGLGDVMTPVMITCGQSERWDKGVAYMPKRDLIVGLELLLEDEALVITKELKWVEALRKEMADMQVKVTAAGNEQYAAWRVGEHDDLVFAVALGCWGARKAFPGRLKGQDGHWVEWGQRRGWDWKLGGR